MFFALNFKRKRSESIFRHLYLFVKRISKNKTFEFQIMYYFNYWFNLELNIIFSGEDHAGPSFEISFLGYILNISIHDNRHWNQEKNDWV